MCKIEILATRENCDGEDGGTNRFTKIAKVVVSAAAVGMFLGYANPVWAHGADAPQPNMVVANCTFTSASMATALNIVHEDTVTPLRISYVIAYAHDNTNLGQAIVSTSGPTAGTPTGDYTGPILCVNSDFMNPPVPVTEATAIPTESHGVASGTIDILNAIGAFILQYSLNFGSEDTENRVCQPVAGQQLCYIAQPQ